MTNLKPSVLILLVAVLLDLIIGDPRWLLHPTQIIGAVISSLEKFFWRPVAAKWYLLMTGFITVIIVVGSSWALTFWLLKVSSVYNSWLHFILAAWLLATTIAPRGLAHCALDISRSLFRGDLIEARKKVSYIVGRDTDNLNEAGIARATIETVAENTSDGIIAPLFYFFWGGVPMAMAYRAVNTLDSMLGYKNERYIYFGRAAAKLDDLVNYIPSRLTGLAFCGAGILFGYGRRALATMLRDARNHPSPNSGYPESAVAGILGIQLGGINFYQGVPSHRPLIGDPIHELEEEHINKSVVLMFIATAISILIGVLYLALLGYWF
ncbi:MAG: adenosylcobinamide-phosphate synthase [Clostridia bacterium]|nr:adenosylcobinamide-phosphate synthase [Clostridia bacterium]